ncbi:putative NMT1/THI5-like protein [metagenome]|uniref:Thiamine pyrimidine synthase n=1 Tax=metagenome TaxID=256318 RepID=A0A2P2C3Z7_9ZZZZ
MFRTALERPRTSRRSAVCLAATLATISLGLTACGDNETDAAHGSTSGTKELTKVTFAMDYLPSTNHNGLAYAMQEGLFEAQGIDLELIPYVDALSDTVIAAGRAETGFSGDGETAMTTFAAGGDMKVIFSGQPHASPVVAALASSGIESPADFAGKTYGGYGLESEKVALEVMMQNDGATGEVDQAVLSVGSTEALKSKQVDLTRLWPEHLYDFDKAGIELNTFEYQDYGIPEGSGPAVMARNDFLEAHDDLAHGLVAALQEGYQMAIDDPAAANAALIAQFPELKTNTDLVDFTSEIYAEDIYANPYGPTGTTSVAQWQAFADYMAENDLLADEGGKVLTSFDPAPYITNDYLPAG